MVIIVSSAQYSVFRRFVSFVQLSKPPMRVLRQTCLLLAFLNTEYWALNIVQAKDFGNHGTIYVIEEEDPMALIQQKLKVMEMSGELQRRNVELQKKTQTSVERPKPVEGITKATKSRIFYFNPTYVVKKNLYDHRGQIFAAQGTKLNPLETVSLSHDLLFFDGDDKDQLMWIRRQLKQLANLRPLKLILVRGAPLKLAEELGTPIYFDQNGVLTKKLCIQHIPARVSQKGMQLKIEEIALPPSRESEIEGAP